MATTIEQGSDSWENISNIFFEKLSGQSQDNPAFRERLQPSSDYPNWNELVLSFSFTDTDGKQKEARVIYSIGNEKPPLISILRILTEP